MKRHIPGCSCPTCGFSAWTQSTPSIGAFTSTWTESSVYRGIQFALRCVDEYRRLSIEFNEGVNPPNAYWNQSADRVWESIRRCHTLDGERLGPISLHRVAEIHYYG